MSRLNKKDQDCGRVERELEYNYQAQGVVNFVLRLALEDISLEEFLDQALEMIIGIPWLSFESRGGIFLMNELSGQLELRSKSNLPEGLLKTCNRVPIGKCHCGKAALTKKAQFSNCLDARHEIRYEGIAEHGHYCVPIISADKALGVINLYIKHGYQYSSKDEEFLMAIANTLAGVIERKRAEDELKLAYTKLRQTQRQLIQSEKMAALGRFASGVAHEVKNPLGIILNGIEYLERKLSACEEDVKTTLGAIKEAISRADRVLLDMLRFSRPSELKPSVIKAADFINEAVSFYKRGAPLSGININTEISGDDIYINIDKNQMQQVVLNLLLNAVDASTQGRDITVKLYRKSLPDSSIAQPACVMEIIDNGCGISKENLSQLFEPFFTTKKEKRGTGLGLSVVKTIVENHQGDLEIESEEGKGTLVRIILPESSRQGR